MREFVSGKLVSGGGICERCGKRLEEGEKVFTPAADMDEIEQFLYCRDCRPPDDGLPDKVLSLQPAVAVEEIGEDERFLGFEVQAGSRCSVCGHVFVQEEWLFVGVVEGLHGGFVYCSDCYEAECDAAE